jgi:hypothetical protein
LLFNSYNGNNLIIVNFIFKNTFMKKKIIFGIMGLLLITFSILSVNMATSNGDISLQNIELMAQANAEVNPLCPTGCKYGGEGCGCNGLWDDHWLIP